MIRHDSKPIDEPLVISLRIRPQDIAYFKFLIESYDDIGVLRTLNAATGEVVILATKDSEKTLHELLESLKDELELHIMPLPDDVSGDWLLSEASANQEQP